MNAPHWAHLPEAPEPNREVRLGCLWLLTDAAQDREQYTFVPARLLLNAEPQRVQYPMGQGLAACCHFVPQLNEQNLGFLVGSEQFSQRRIGQC